MIKPSLRKRIEKRNAEVEECGKYAVLMLRLKKVWCPNEKMLINELVKWRKEVLGMVL